MCRERDSNPHGHFWPRDFKSLVSTNSTIAAQLFRIRECKDSAYSRIKQTIFSFFVSFCCQSGFFWQKYKALFTKKSHHAFPLPYILLKLL